MNREIAKEKIKKILLECDSHTHRMSAYQPGASRVMRITETQRQSITQAIHTRDPLASVYLFGSRADDAAHGGDMDIFVLSKTIRLIDRLNILGELHQKLGEQKIDLVVYPDLTRPFARIAINEGIRL